MYSPSSGQWCRLTAATRAPSWKRQCAACSFSALRQPREALNPLLLKTCPFGGISLAKSLTAFDGNARHPGKGAHKMPEFSHCQAASSWDVSFRAIWTKPCCPSLKSRKSIPKDARHSARQRFAQKRQDCPPAPLFGPVKPNARIFMGRTAFCRSVSAYKGCRRTQAQGGKPSALPQPRFQAFGKAPLRHTSLPEKHKCA